MILLPFIINMKIQNIIIKNIDDCYSIFSND
ncbi:hypothetical protein BCD_1765 (plasmid) [Borrelia crocidurae DOU]|uniref:Uncharacterized protein n=1 Tax=Borrelia crocidurae DOU TaxID=1293575 RepID=W5SS03_9SPIR|nr:hypothetical protein BCD_1765 [Borrelia crocidurae DOU]